MLKSYFSGCKNREICPKKNTASHLSFGTWNFLQYELKALKILLLAGWLAVCMTHPRPSRLWLHDGPFFAGTYSKHFSLSKQKSNKKPCQTSQKESTQERERKRNKQQGPKSRQANSPKEAYHTEVSEPLSTETSTSCMKHIN